MVTFTTMIRIFTGPGHEKGERMENQTNTDSPAESCATCRFYVPNMWASPDIPTAPSGTSIAESIKWVLGHCRRRSPTNEFKSTAFPLMPPDQWCGEYIAIAATVERVTMIDLMARSVRAAETAAVACEKTAEAMEKIATCVVTGTFRTS